jgi:hypothetical protein
VNKVLAANKVPARVREPVGKVSHR